MPKTIKPARIDRCNGCELCVLETQRQLKKVGLDESLIRIFRKRSLEQQKTEFNLEIDPRINVLDLEKIKSICPRNVFEIIEESENND